MTFPPSSHRGGSCDPHASLLICCIRMTTWTLSMEKPDCSSQEEERLKKENDTLRRRIQMLEAEISRLRAKLISTWGE